MSDILEMEFNVGSVLETGKFYTADSVKYDDYEKPFTPVELKEYIYDNSKFVRA